LIDFRYHVVSIVAVFLSLAIGLVLGANALQQPVLHTLTDSNKSLHSANSDLRAQNSQQKSQIGALDQFAGGLSGQIVAGRLRNQSVVFVQTPGGSTTIYNQLKNLVTEAGARVTGEVTVQGQYLQQDKLAELAELTTSEAPPSMTFPDGATPYDKAGAVLASAIVTKQGNQASSTESAGILSAFSTASFITTSATPLPRATLAIVIPPSFPDRNNAANDNKALVSLASALGGASLATVMAGPLSAASGGGSGGTISALRESNASGRVSSVDSVDAPTANSGQVVVVLALQSQMLSGKAGAYGLGEGAGGYLPNPVPAPTSQPTTKAQNP
jgi:hypothetical protein